MTVHHTLQSSHQGLRPRGTLRQVGTGRGQKPTAGHKEVECSPPREGGWGGLPGTLNTISCGCLGRSSKWAVTAQVPQDMLPRADGVSPQGHEEPEAS